MPSLDLLLQTVMAERDKQLAHFDALDTKAGVLLAFDGVLIAFQRPIRAEFQVPGTVLAAARSPLNKGGLGGKSADNDRLCGR
jgi:hypothetical protein